MRNTLKNKPKSKIRVKFKNGGFKVKISLRNEKPQKS